MDSPDAYESTDGRPAWRAKGSGPALAVLGILVAASCDVDPFVPDADAAIEGVIVSLTGANGPLDEGTMHVRTEPVEDDPCGIIFRVQVGTDILLRSGGLTRTGDPADLGVGRLVKVWAFGGVAESCPGQAGADVIEIDDDFIVEPLAIRTSATGYTLQPHDFGIGLETDIPYVLANLTDDDIYIVNCGGWTSLELEKRVDGEWVSAWSPVRFGCLSPPIVIPPGRSVSRQLHVFGGDADCNCGPRFEVEEPRGTYRLRFHDILHTYDEDARPFGEPLPLEMRVSNPFEIR